jgi:small multidrug resistance family-3 protein
LSAVRIDGNDDPQWTAKCVLLQSLAETLTNADEQHRQGHLSAVEHDASWWDVYDRLIPSWADRRRVS